MQAITVQALLALNLPEGLSEASDNPSGTSKWNRIEHKLFSQISINWRGRPLTSYQTIISLIAATTTSTGLKVYARLDEGTYETGVKITQKQMNALNLHRHDFHGDWNYTIKPTQPADS